MRSFLVFLTALLLIPAVSQAAPITYGFTGGSLTLTVSHSGQTFAPATIDLDGVQVTVDTAAPALISLELTAAGPVTLNMAPFGGYDTIVLESLRLSAGLGTLMFLAPGPPADEYFFVANPLLSEAIFSASDMGVPVIVSELVSSSDFAGGQLFIDTSMDELTLSGITIASFGDNDEFTIKGDFIFSGSADNPIPEPSAALVFAIGMATVTVARSAGRAKAHGMRRGSSSKG